jgi:hypothetical protein
MTPDIRTGLAEKLWVAATYLRHRIKDARESGEISETLSLFVRNKVTHFSYGDQGGVNLTLSVEYVQRSEWPFAQQWTFAGNAARDSSEVRDCVPAIVAELGVDAGRPRAISSALLFRSCRHRQMTSVTAESSP